MRVVTPRHIADQVRDWHVRDGKRTKLVSRRTALAVLDALWECNKRNQMYVFPQVEIIADHAGIRSRSTITLALTALEDQGLIRVLGPRHGGRRHPTVWGLVDNDETNRWADGFQGRNQPLSDRNQPLSGQEPTAERSPNQPLSGHVRKRELEERKEERRKRQPPLRLITPSEPSRACRCPVCQETA
jgi:hypothetical protein